MDNKDKTEELVQQQELVLPSTEVGEGADLVSEGVKEALTADKIQRVLIRETEEWHDPSYLVDVSRVGDMPRVVLDGFKTMITGGDTAVYFKNESGVTLAGFGETEKLYRELETYCGAIFGEACKVYKYNGKGFEPCRALDVSCVKLKL